MPGRSTNNSDIKKRNRNRVFRYINDREETSMPEVSAALEISGPTVLTIARELLDAGLIEIVGEFSSTGGRKAKAIASVKNIRYAIGIEITQNHVGLVYTNLSRKVLGYRRYHRRFENTAEYFTELGNEVSRFAAENRIPQERVAGIGLAVAGIVDQEHGCIPRSHTLGIRDVLGETWKSYLPYPCEMLNEANAAAFMESFAIRGGTSAVYLSLSNSVGGGIIYCPRYGEEALDPVVRDHSFSNIFVGNSWRGGEFGHMVIHPGGKACYCGKKGCLDAYCSASLLSGLEGGKLERFFNELKSGNPEYEKVWSEYLSNLVIAIDNLRMCFDCDVILGGYVGCYIEPYLLRLRELAAELNIFEGGGEYVRACVYKQEASALGAAVYQLEKYVDSV